MPTSIPYDPSLVLGSVVPPGKLENLLQISELLAPIDAAQETLNSFIAMKRSIDMTTQELINMNVSPAALKDKSAEVGKSISKAAVDYATIRIDQETKIQPLRAKVSTVHASIESPIDYVRTELKSMPLSADSIKLDAQYFSFDENSESADNSMSAIKSYVADSTAFLGDDVSVNMSTSAAKQVSKQRSTHKVAGTLVITASCTHKNAVVLAPFYLNVDKAVRVWNSIFKEGGDRIEVDDPANMAAIAKGEGAADEKSFTMLSGATYGSSFVGMVHILRTDDTRTSQKMTSVAESLQVQFDIGGWFANEGGGIGVDSSFSNDIKNMLSSQNITSHVTLITMGCIPSIKSNQLQIGVRNFSKENFDPSKMMGNLATLANATTSEKNSVAEAATKARTSKTMIAMQSAQATSVMTALGDIDDGQNKVLDINSMMTAFEDYIDKAIAGAVGVPINYYTKPITRAQIAEMWVSKYFPGKFLSISGDDSAPTPVNNPDQPQQ